MLKFIFSTVGRRRDRLALILLGIFLISFGSGIAAATARSTQGVVDEELARHWRTDYDLLVRHPDAVNEFEEKHGVVPGNYQGNLSKKSITQSQLEAIRNVPGVEVAAPLAFVGFMDVIYDLCELDPAFSQPLDLPPGQYIVDFEIIYHNGVREIKEAWRRPGSLTVPEVPESSEDDDEVLLSSFDYSLRTLVIAVDPDAEASLTGLDEAVVSGIYMDQFSGGGISDREFPALFNYNSLLKLEWAAYVRTENMGDTVWEASGQIYSEVGDSGSQGYFSRRIGPPMIVNEGDSGFYLNAWATSGSVMDAAFVDFPYLSSPWLDRTPEQLFRPAPPRIDDSYDSIWGYTLRKAGFFSPELMDISPPGSLVSAPLELYSFRPPTVLETPWGEAGKAVIPTHHLGYGTLPVGAIIRLSDMRHMTGSMHIDSVRVRVSGVEDMSEQSQVRIAAVAQAIRDATGLHVDVVLGSSRQRMPVRLNSYNSAAREDYRNMITDIMADLVPELKAITGLNVYWDFGSYPHSHTFYLLLPQENRDHLLSDLTPLLDCSLGGILDLSELQIPPDGHENIQIIIPDYEIRPDEERDFYALVEEYWTQLGTQMRIYHETNRGTFWITMGLLMVGALFIGNTTYISAVGRTSEFATLSSLGWRRGTVFRASLSETLIISLTAGVVTAGVLAAIWHFSDRYLEPWLLLVVVPAVVVTFLIGSIPPLIRTLFIPPLQGVRRGELKTTTRLGGARPIGFILRGLIARPGRTFVTALAMIFPAGTLAIMFFIYFGIQALLGETLLGEYLAVELRGYHFVLNALIFAVAGLAVTDTLLINLRERQKEFGILKAIGWKNRTVAGLLLWEGVGLGLLSGVIGTVIAGVVYTQVFAMLPPGLWVNGPLLAVVPALVAGLAAIVPALRAARIPAAQVIREE